MQHSSIDYSLNHLSKFGKAFCTLQPYHLRRKPSSIFYSLWKAERVGRFLTFSGSSFHKPGTTMEKATTALFRLAEDVEACES